ncbi:MAG: GNAT family N-acetyltransferase [Acidimicrobiia bacterium]
MNPESLAALMAAALPDEPLTAAELETCCFAEGMAVLGDETGAVAVTSRSWDDWTVAWILLVAVHPDHRRRGRGRGLVQQAVEWARARHARELHLGTAIPRYVWPGVDFRFTGALCLFEACGFQEYGAGFNMDIPTSYRAPTPDGITIEREIGAGSIDLARAEFPHWEDEVTRGIAGGGCFAARNADGETVGFGCHSVNRDTLIGPMATDPNRRHHGVGRALLAALCADIGARYGVERCDISWVGPVRFYAKSGATVSRVFRYAKLPLT